MSSSNTVGGSARFFLSFFKWTDFDNRIRRCIPKSRFPSDRAGKCVRLQIEVCSEAALSVKVIVTPSTSARFQLPGFTGTFVAIDIVAREFFLLNSLLMSSRIQQTCLPGGAFLIYKTL